MELRQLAYFDAVVTHGGFGRAAAALHVAQPAVSVQVRKLESELGVALLARTTRQVRLTHAGELFLARARRVLAEVEGARAEAAGSAGAMLGRVRIGSIQALDPFDLTAALAAFHARHPAVELALRSGRLRELLDGLDDGALDLAVGPIPAEHAALAERYTITPLFTDELVLVTEPGHATAGRGALRLSELRDEPFACLPADSGLRATLDRLAAADGFVAHVPFETASLPRLRDLVAHGLGVGLFARSVAEASGRPVVIHSVDPGPVWRPVGLLSHAGRALAPAATACRAFIAARAR